MTIYTVVSSDVEKLNRGHQATKHYVKLSAAGVEDVIVYTASNLPVLVDATDFTTTSGSLHSTGYIYKQHVTLHSTIMQKRPKVANSTIDHINQCKRDNRKANLRWASQGEQNENRITRADKIPADPELQKLGIFNLPRYIRWDSSELKFVLEIDSKAISGTKSSKVSLVNKFRDCAQKLRDYLIAEDTSHDFVKLRVKLAKEYNDIVTTAHKHDPDNFPAGPRLDLELLGSDLTYVESCLEMLPPPAEDEVLHGALNVASTNGRIPEINAFAITKRDANGVDKKIVFDLAFEKLVNKFPSITVGDSSPYVTASPISASAFPQLDLTAEDLKKKRKILLKDIVWSVFMQNGPIPEDHIVVPLNYQQFDLRADNLVRKPGGPKNHKGLLSIPVAHDAIYKSLGMRYWPRTVSIGANTASKSSPITLAVNTSNGIKRANCSDSTIVEVFTKKMIPILLADNPDFEADNAKYQKLMHEYVTYIDF